MRRIGWILGLAAGIAPLSMFACSDEPSPKGAWTDAYVAPEPEPKPEPETDAGPETGPGPDGGTTGDAKADADASGG